MRIAFVLAMAFASRPGFAEESLDPARVAGCYEFRIGAWKPSLRLGADAQFVTPPGRIQLELKSVEHPWIEGSRRVLQIPGGQPSIHERGEWSVVGRGEVNILWTTGFSGLRVTLQEETGGLRGKARTFWDFHRRTQAADVIAEKVPCPSS